MLGFDPDPDTARGAVKRGAVDALLEDPERAGAEAGLVVTAVPPRTATSLVPRLLASIPAGATLTDLSSVMLPVCLPPNRSAWIGESAIPLRSMVHSASTF